MSFSFRRFTRFVKEAPSSALADVDRVAIVSESGDITTEATLAELAGAHAFTSTFLTPAAADEAYMPLAAAAPLTAGRWVGPSFAVIGTVAPASSGVGIAAPFVVAEDGSLDRLLAEVTTGQTGGAFDIGAWANVAGDLYPGALIAGETGLSGTSNAVVSSGAVAVPVAAGQIVWLGVIARGAGTQPTFRSGTGLLGGLNLPRNGSLALSIAFTAVQSSGISAGLPNPWPGGGSVGASAGIRVVGRVG